MLDSLRVFQLVARYGSFTRAAETAGLTRPAVSQQIKHLEQQFGVSLFDRNTRQVSLTPAGAILLEHAGRVLETFKDLEQAMEEARRTVRRVLAIGASTLPGESLLPAVLASFRQANPGVEVQVRMGNSNTVLQMLREGQVVVGLVGLAVEEPGLHCEPVAYDEVVLALPPGYEAPDPLPVDLLHRIPLVLREPGSATRATAMDSLRTAGVDLHQLQVAAELGSPEATKAAVRSGVGAAFLSRCALTGSDLRHVRVDGVDLRRPVCAVWRKEQPPAAEVRALVERLACRDGNNV